MADKNKRYIQNEHPKWASEADDDAEFLGAACAATDLVIINDFNGINVNGG